MTSDDGCMLANLVIFIQIRILHIAFFILLSPHPSHIPCMPFLQEDEPHIMSRSLDAQVLAVNVQRDGLSPPMARSYERQGLSSDNINMGIDYCKFSLLAGTKRCISFPAQQEKYVLRYVFDGRDWITCGLLTNNRLSPRRTHNRTRLLQFGGVIFLRLFDSGDIFIDTSKA